MDDFINQLTSIATTWQSAGALAASILIVNLLVNLTKLKLFQDKVSAGMRSYIAAGLGMAAGVITALIKGLPIPQAIVSGLVIGLGAIGTHEVVTNAKTSVRLRYAVRKANHAAKPLVALVVVLLVAGASAQASSSLEQPLDQRSWPRRT